MKDTTADFDTYTKKQKDHWFKTNKKLAASPETPPERLPPIPKPSNWANMTAKEKRHWEYKHK